MLMVLSAVLQIYFIIHGIRQEERAKAWSWSKFVFCFVFAGLQFFTIFIPIDLVSPGSRYFTAMVVGVVGVAVFNFVWFIIVCRRWRLPDGRTSLQAYYDEHPEKKRPENAP
jgi:hypothetical protein